mmetsp:Transcript_20699/g.57220  ORF Transcript_20699/g.57220 Transcript_20699/m.57220 type:complete len:137 (+) Transcript_20699:94-504(+)
MLTGQCHQQHSRSLRLREASRRRLNTSKWQDQLLSRWERARQNKPVSAKCRSTEQALRCPGKQRYQTAWSAQSLQMNVALEPFFMPLKCWSVFSNPCTWAGFVVPTLIEAVPLNLYPSKSCANDSASATLMKLTKP